MCGIGFWLYSLVGNPPVPLFAPTIVPVGSLPSILANARIQLHESLVLRGPSHDDELHIQDSLSGPILFQSSVLHLRGSSLQPQPVTNSQQTRFLQFNGEIYSFRHHPSLTRSLEDDPSVNDASLLFSHLSTHCTTSDEVLEVLSSIVGPFALVYVDLDNGFIVIAKDRIGRRSLLLSCVVEEGFAGECVLVASSVSERRRRDYENEESELFRFNWMEMSPSSVLILTRQPIVSRLRDMRWVGEERSWVRIRESLCHDLHPYDINRSSSALILRANPRAEEEEEGEGESLIDASVQFCSDLLADSTRIRLHSWRGASFSSTYSIGILFSGGLDSFLLAALTLRTVRQGHGQGQGQGQGQGTPFTIDLLNVNFGDRIGADRKQAIESFEILERRLLQESESEDNERESESVVVVRLILIDVTSEELRSSSGQILECCVPNSTVLDFNLAAALFFAARGNGMVYSSSSSSSSSSSQTITSTSSILLSGLGADELFGGYKRHKTRLLRGPKQSRIPDEMLQPPYWDVLAEELDLDIRRLWKRNLGRDDRIVASLGKEVRWPFLDERVIALARGIEVELVGVSRRIQLNEICDMFRFGRGEGDKRILRRICGEVLGFEEIARLPKRAMQFGSNVSKVAFRKSRGSDLIQSLETVLESIV